MKKSKSMGPGGSVRHEAFAAFISDSVEDAFFTVDVDGRILDLNRATRLLDASGTFMPPASRF